jgi:choline transporter-like protein 2/4/5
MGSAAFGSLIIAIIKTIRAVLTYFTAQAKKAHNLILVYVLSIINCCLWCLEKCMKFLNKNAYIQTAIYGYSFCKSCRRAFFLLIRNILRVAAVNTVINDIH